LIYKITILTLDTTFSTLTFDNTLTIQSIQLKLGQYNRWHCVYFYSYKLNDNWQTWLTEIETIYSLTAGIYYM